jgi:maleate isomerase
MTRRQAIVSGAAAAVGLAAGWRAEAADQTSAITAEPMQRGAGKTITGALSGRPVFIPDVNFPPMPSIAPPGPIYNGEPTDLFDVAKLSDGHPDACSYRRRFGLIIPATNTTMESELWNIIVRNRDNGLDGIGLHTSTVMTPKPDVSSAKGIEQYRQHFLGGVNQAVKSALLAGPQYFTMAQIEENSELSWATWHDAAKAALERYGAKRIGLITPFERAGNESAARMFRDSGFEVVATFGFACANAQHIAHIPNEAKEKAVLELLATKENNLDAVVQCGTNMSMTAVAEKLEPQLGIPILGINATLLWYALRENGFNTPVLHAGRLLREF